jgi:hypothetical protein
MYKFTFILGLILLTVIKSEAQQQTTKAQEPPKYLIIDRKLKQPLAIADTITDGQMSKGFFAIEKQNADSLISKLQWLSGKLRQVMRYDFDETKWDIGSTSLKIKVVTYGFGDRLNVALRTDLGDRNNKDFYIVDAKLTNNDNARYLNRLIKYIRN